MTKFDVVTRMGRRLVYGSQPHSVPGGQSPIYRSFWGSLIYACTL